MTTHENQAGEDRPSPTPAATPASEYLADAFANHEVAIAAIHQRHVVEGRARLFPTGTPLSP